jgi:hypothetical protein
MTNIVIIGDSWGVPNHGGPPGAPADSHTEILLRNLGYNLINFSENGDSNDNALTRVHNYVNQGNPVDWIIWFHSEMIRERHLFNPYEPYRINEAIQQISEYVYRKFEVLRVKTQAKTIVIGSQAPVLDTFSEYAFSDYIIKDWRSDICGRQLPMVQSLGQIDLVESTANLATLEEKLDLLTNGSESKIGKKIARLQRRKYNRERSFPIFVVLFALFFSLYMFLYILFPMIIYIFREWVIYG